MKRKKTIRTIQKILVGVIGLIFFFIIIINLINQINGKKNLQKFVDTEPIVKVNTSIIVIYEEITEENCRRIISNLKLLASDQRVKEIKIFLYSYGGDAICGLAISKVMHQIDKPIIVYARMAVSSASLILLAGTPGKRFISKNGLVFIHQPHYSFENSSSFIKKYLQMEDFITKGGFVTRQYVKEYMWYCHQSAKRVKKDMKKGTRFNAEESIKYGFADYVF